MEKLTRVDSQDVAGDAGETSAAVSQTSYVFPVTFAQQRLWFLDRLQPGDTSYNVAWSIRMTGQLNVAALEQSLNEIVRRHEVLRTTFSVQDGEPAQVVTPALKFALPVVDLSNCAERESEAQRLAAEEAETSFDLQAGPLVRGQLLRLGQAEHVLLLTMHHIIFDGWSRSNFSRELAALYGAFSQGKPSPLQELHLQYADYAVWQREQLKGDLLAKEFSYWKKQLGGVSPLELPLDHPRPPVQTSNGARHNFVCPRSLLKSLQELGRAEGTTLFMTTLAAFQLLLHRYAQQDEVAVGTPIAGRNRKETEGLIGFFVNTLVIRVDMSGNPTFRELLGRVRQVTLDAFSHQELPFEKVVEELQPERSLSYNPIFQVMFALQNTPYQAFELAGLELAPLEAMPTKAKFDLALTLTERSEGLRGSLVYNTDLLEPATIARLMDHYLTVISAVVEHPDERIGALPLLSDAERHRILVEWNNTAAEYPADQCIHQLFEAQVRRTPDAPALTFGNQRYTYAELNKRANQLARYLRDRGVGPEVRVGLSVERSMEMVIGLIGILKAGGAYVPLDPDYPKERFAFLLEDADIEFLLTQQRLVDRLPKHQARVICLDSNWAEIARESADDLPNLTRVDNLAYVIYTSGSTGKPKGVLVEHRGIGNLALAQIGAVGTTPSSRVLQFASLSFDASVWEIFGAFLAGAALCLADAESLMPGPPLLRLLRDQRITTATFPPSALRALDAEELPELRTIVVAGEACSAELVRKWALGRRFINAYGPTEGTVCATLTRCGDGDQDPSIGKPIANMQAYILDRNRQPVPPGVPGELYIGGVGLARGYHRRPELTAERFVEGVIPGHQRLYRTGDRAAYLPDGDIRFLGRVDDQVKVRGFRVEPQEIELALSQHEAVREVVVGAREDSAGNAILAAYIVAKPGCGVTPATLRAFLKTSLPNHMIPSAFVFLDSLPVTPHGKLDRKALPVPPPAVLAAAGAGTAGSRDVLALRLLDIWEEVLGVGPIGLADNFFDLGGHSLLAVRLLVAIEKALGHKLPLAVLFQAPTVAQMATFIREQAGKVPLPTLISIQPLGSRPPVFCVSRPNVNALGFVFLARHLGKDQPVYGLQANMHEEAVAYTQKQYEAKAAEYIEAMEQVGSKGPYFLTGFCEGAHIAFEMARQLQQRGRKVGMIAILDVWPVENTYSKFFIAVRYYLFLLRSFSKMSVREKTVFAKRQTKRLFQVTVGRFGKAQPPSVLATGSSGVSRKQRYWPGPDYRPPVFDGKITLFRVKVQPYYRIRDAHMGWRERAAGGVEIVPIPGQHPTILREPYVKVLAEKMKERIDAVLNASRES